MIHRRTPVHFTTVVDPSSSRLVFVSLVLILLVACQPVGASILPPTLVIASPTGSSSPLPSPSPTAEVAPSFTPQPVLTHTLAPPSPAPSATPTLTFTATVPAITTLLFTGVIVPARCVQAALDENGNPDHPYEEIHPIIQAADIAIGSFNATMSDRVVHTGCIDTYQLVGSPQNADAAARAGFDLMSVATNHIKDCGIMKAWCNETFFDTLDNLHRVGILTVGAGKNLEEAMQPVVIMVNGVRFGFVSLGDSKLDLSVFAGEDWPGIAHLNDENLRSAVMKVKQVADVIIVMPHWGSEDNILPNGIQRNQAESIISLGIDLVVGNHTHVIQAFHTLKGVPVFYGLGNFIFDQGTRDHRQGAILQVRFQGTQYLGYELIMTYHERNGRVHLADDQETAEIMQRLQEANTQLP